jgi:hypothetical protein
MNITNDPAADYDAWCDEQKPDDDLHEHILGMVRNVETDKNTVLHATVRMQERDDPEFDDALFAICRDNQGSGSLEDAIDTFRTFIDEELYRMMEEQEGEE